MDVNRSAPQMDSRPSDYSSAPTVAERDQAHQQDIRSICHLIASREHGEMERHVTDLSRWQAQNTDAKVSVIAHPRYRNSLDERVKFIPLNTDRSRHHPTLVWRLANHIRAGEYQIAHGHGSKSAQLLAAVQKYTEARQVITRHNVRHPRDKLASAFAARIAVSRAAVTNSRLDWNIIPNGIEPAITNALPAKVDLRPGPSIVVATRLLKLQGMDVLLEAMTRLPDIQLIVLGDGPDSAGLKRLSKKLNLGNRATFLGYTDNIAAFMRAADLFLIPSPAEVTTYTLIEALLNRCPVVSGYSAYTEEYIPPNYLLNQLEPMYLAEKLRYTLQDSNRLQSDFEPVFARATNELTLEQMARSTWQVYTQLLA